MLSSLIIDELLKYTYELFESYKVFQFSFEKGSNITTERCFSILLVGVR